jgi:hypothetical protein
LPARAPPGLGFRVKSLEFRLLGLKRFRVLGLRVRVVRFRVKVRVKVRVYGWGLL